MKKLSLLVIASAIFFSQPAISQAKNIVGIGVAGSNDRVYTLYNNRVVSSGMSSNLAKYRNPYSYSLPAGKFPHNIVAMAIAGSNDYKTILLFIKREFTK